VKQKLFQTVLIAHLLWQKVSRCSNSMYVPWLGDKELKGCD